MWRGLKRMERLEEYGGVGGLAVEKGGRTKFASIIQIHILEICMLISMQILSNVLIHNINTNFERYLLE